MKEIEDTIAMVGFTLVLSFAALIVALLPLWRIAKALESLARTAHFETGLEDNEHDRP